MTTHFLKEFSEAFGKHLKGLRTKRGLTQQQLAEASDLSVGYISLVENGKVDIRVENIYALSVVLGVEQKEMLNFRYKKNGSKSRTI